MHMNSERSYHSVLLLLRELKNLDACFRIRVGGAWIQQGVSESSASSSASDPIHSPKKIQAYRWNKFRWDQRSAQSISTNQRNSQIKVKMLSFVEGGTKIMNSIYTILMQFGLTPSWNSQSLTRMNRYFLMLWKRTVTCPAWELSA